MDKSSRVAPYTGSVSLALVDYQFESARQNKKTVLNKRTVLTFLSILLYSLCCY